MASDFDPRASVFGREIFSARNLTFAPSYNIPTPPNYVLGAGDEVVVEVWGDAESTMKHRVSPEGSISISGVGPLRGRRFFVQKEPLCLYP